jgi:hypothetical protein
VVAALCGFFGDMFPSSCVLETGTTSARCVGGRIGGAPRADTASPGRIPFDHGGWLREMIARPQISVLDQVKDPHLAALLDEVGLPPGRVAVAPVVDAGGLSHLILCQGLSEAEVKPSAGRLMRYVQAASDALRMVALRDAILARARADAAERLTPDQASTRHRDFSRAAADPRLRELSRGSK